MLFFDEHEIPVNHVLTDRGTEYCGRHDRHEYEIYLAVEDIDHTKTKTKSPQTNGICERFHRTILHLPDSSPFSSDNARVRPAVEIAAGDAHWLVAVVRCRRFTSLNSVESSCWYADRH